MAKSTKAAELPVAIDDLESVKAHYEWLVARMEARQRLIHNIMTFVKPDEEEDAQKWRKLWERIREEKHIDGVFSIGYHHGRLSALPVTTERASELRARTTAT